MRTLINRKSMINLLRNQLSGFAKKQNIINRFQSATSQMKTGKQFIQKMMQ